MEGYKPQGFSFLTAVRISTTSNINSMSVIIKINNLKGICSLDFELPSRSGVYVITGLNGCGKTSLLVAIHRMTNSMAFKDNFMQATEGIDQYANSSVTYVINDESVDYRHRRQRWVPTPKSKSHLLENAGIQCSRFISTSGMRFFMPDKTKIPAGNLRYQNVAESIKNAMNSILGTQKFSNLRFVQVNPRIGRRPEPYRSDKLYVVRNGNNIYSEYCFSLGERLLLNILDFIENVPQNSILLIDEIELALHPLAQVKFYDHLKKVADEKRLRVFLTTHSSSLIKHACSVLYLDATNGVVNVVKDCKPAYVLKDVSAYEESNPDYLIFVEDDMAKMLLHAILNNSDVAKRKHRVCRIIDVGGYEQVIDMTKQFYTIAPFNNRKVCAFLDKDVEDIVEDLRNKGNNATADEKRLLTKIKELKDDHNIYYLNITPEIGVWKWIKHDSRKLMSYLVDEYGDQNFNMQQLVNEADALPANNANQRKEGKTKLKALAEKLMQNMDISSISRCYEDMMRAYAKDYMSVQQQKAEYVQKLESVLNR